MSETRTLDDMTNAEKLADAAIGFLALTPHLIFCGWSLHLLWKWFAVRLGLPPISVVEGMGLTLILRWAKSRFDQSVSPKKSWLCVRSLCFALTFDLTILGMGAVLVRFL